MLTNPLIKGLLFSLLLIQIQGTVLAQNIFENHRTEVYPYLSRMAQKGLVTIDDYIQPISRQAILMALLELQKNESILSKIEKAELNFYLKEYNTIEGLTNKDNTKADLLKKDENGRWRTIAIHAKDFQFNIDPIANMQVSSNDGNKINQVSNGFSLWGASKNIGFQLYYRDCTETGDLLKLNNFETPNAGNIRVGLSNDNRLNYSEVRGNISYSWKNGSVNFGKDNFLWGYGENGRIVASDKAPSFPYFRLDYKPLQWLSFNYMHAWLNSNLTDSMRTYNTWTGGVSGDIRVRYISKFLVTHSIKVTPMKGLDLSLGESMVYSDKLDVGFLIPINFFKVYDNNRSNYLINAGSNGQIFMQASSRNQIKNTHLYTTVFIDEIRLTEVFNKSKSRNQLGYTMGGSVTDFFIPYLTVGAEYTRVNPFVYNNLIPAQRYTQYDYSLGDWMGANMDRQLLFVKYTPLPKLKLYARYQSIRKGGAGSIWEQYAAEPQPAFLFGLEKNRKDVYFQATYEVINNLYVKGVYQQINETYTTGQKISNSLIQMGISFGLN
jgi:hypothetical protein